MMVIVVLIDSNGIPIASALAPCKRVSPTKVELGACKFSIDRNCMLGRVMAYTEPGKLIGTTLPVVNTAGVSDNSVGMRCLQIESDAETIAMISDPAIDIPMHVVAHDAEKGTP